MKIIRTDIEWFGSIKQLTYKFQKGLNLIAGENGVGKTSIFNALFWCLYGELLKKDCWVEPWEHVKDETYLGTRVATRISISKEEAYWIVRCKDFSGKVGKRRGENGLFIFDVYSGQELNIKGKASKQKWIVEKIGYSADLFRTIVILPQEIGKLMDEDGPSKKQIFEEAFEASFISKAKDAADLRLKELSEQLWKSESKVENQKTLVGYKRNELTNAKNMYNDFEIERKKKLETLRDEFNYLTNKMSVLKKEISGYGNDIFDIPKKEKALKKLKAKVNDEVSKEEFRLDFKIKGLQGELEDKKLELKNLTKNKIKRCPNCGQKISVSKAKEKSGELISLINKIKKTLIPLEKQYKEIQGKLKSQNILKKKIERKEIEIIKLSKQFVSMMDTQGEYTKLSDNQIQISKDIRRVKEEQLMIDVDKIRKEYITLKLKLNGHIVEHRRIKKEHKVNEWLIKDPLSNSGLKAYIFDTMLRVVNKELIKYKDFIGFSVRVMVDLEGSRKDIKIVINKKGDNILYGNLSKGQKQLTNVALIFALNDVVTKQKPINILLMDEPFESLSKNNVEKVANIIQNKSLTHSVHLITHLNSFVLNYSNSINLVLSESGLTELVA